MTLLLREKTRTTVQAIGYVDTGDLETGTATIVPTARPAIASAQYSYNGTLTKITDPRIVVNRITARLNVNISTLGTATHLYCSVRVDVDDADHEIFNEDWDSTGNKLDALDLHLSSKPDVFALFADGAAHTIYFMFWADAASQVQIDVVEAWVGHGSCGTTDTIGSPPPSILDFHTEGWGWCHPKYARIGSGNMYSGFRFPENTWMNLFGNTTPSAYGNQIVNVAAGKTISSIAVQSVATDICYIEYIRFTTLRSTGNRVKLISYEPGCKDTGDLEAATKTITATLEASGLVNADYSSAQTLTAPSDARMIVDRIAARLAATIDSLSTGANLRCRVYVDVQDADHLLFDETWDASGAKLDAVDTHSGALATVFGLLADGTEHTFYYFFWKDAAGVGDTVISLVETWYGAGSCRTTAASYGNPLPSSLRIKHQGRLYYSVYFTRNDGSAGSGNANAYIADFTYTWMGINQGTASSAGKVQGAAHCYAGTIFATLSTVATELAIINKAFIYLGEN